MSEGGLELPQQSWRPVPLSDRLSWNCKGSGGIEGHLVRVRTPPYRAVSQARDDKVMTSSEANWHLLGPARAPWAARHMGASQKGCRPWPCRNGRHAFPTIMQELCTHVPSTYAVGAIDRSARLDCGSPVCDLKCPPSCRSLHGPDKATARKKPSG